MKVKFEDIVENMNDEQLAAFLKKMFPTFKYEGNRDNQDDYWNAFHDWAIDKYPGTFPAEDDMEAWGKFTEDNTPFMRYLGALQGVYPFEEESVTESDVNGDGDTDVTAVDTDDNGKEDTAVVTADSKEEAKEGIKDAVDTVKGDTEETEVDSTGTAEVDDSDEYDSDEYDTKEGSKRNKKALTDYTDYSDDIVPDYKLSDKKAKDTKGTCYDDSAYTCSDESMKNVMSSLLNYRY